MKKGQVVSGYVEETTFPDRGILHIEDEKVTVKGVLPGQTVTVSIKKTKKGKAEGRLLSVETPSSLESETPPCPHFGKCGGCSLQTLPYAAQLSLKETQVQRLLCEAWGGELPFLPAAQSPSPWAYRNKMEFSFGDEQKDGPLCLGLHKKNSFYDVIPVADCQIVDEDFRTILRETQVFFRQEGIPFYHKMTRQGVLRHLLVRKTKKSGEILVILVTTTQGEVPLARFREMLLALPLTGTLTGILHTKNDSLADAICNEGSELLYGRDFICEELLGLRFQISPFSFFQTNSAGAEVLYQTVREFVGETKDRVVFDLYSGTGTIGQLLAPVAKEVIGVELIEEAVEAAKQNAAANGLSNCTFLAGDVLWWLDHIETKPDVIVVDPPREGLHPKALVKLLAYGVETFVYVSCKPTSLAKDMEGFREAGYEVEAVRLVDMFPQTSGIETVVKFKRRRV